MLAEFFPADAGDTETVAGSARWQADTVHIEASDQAVRESLARIFRPTPVVLENQGQAASGAHGGLVLRPGSVEWFRGAAQTRAAEEGFTVRLVPGISGPGGWDPASAYRTFPQTVRRMMDRSGGR